MVNFSRRLFLGCGSVLTPFLTTSFLAPNLTLAHPQEIVRYASREALTKAIADGKLNDIPEGAVVFGGGLDFLKIHKSHPLYEQNPIPDMPGFVPATEITLQHWGFRGEGTKEDTSLGNSALHFAGMIGGGNVYLRSPGVYLLENTNQFDEEIHPEISDRDPVWWLNRRALHIAHSNVFLILGPGVVLKLNDGADCSAIQIGHYDTYIEYGDPVSNVGVVGEGWQVDMNKARQTPSGSKKNHPCGILVASNSSYVEISGGYIHSSPYYGIGFEGPLADVGNAGCRISDMRIEDCEADGIDAKDYDTSAATNIMSQVLVRNCGASENFLSGQSGIDVRGGWVIENCRVEFSDEFSGQRVGIRVQRASDTAPRTKSPSRVENCVVVGHGRYIETVGFRIGGYGATVRNCIAYGMDDGFRWSAPNAKMDGIVSDDCNIGFHWYAASDTQSDGVELYGGIARNCNSAWKIEDGVDNVKIFGGALEGEVSKPLIIVGDNTDVNITGVVGFLSK